MRASSRLGPYELTELLGQGGMGAVFRARHVELGVERAIKTLTGALSPTRVERFLRETQVLARIDHPNVVRIHEAAQDPQSGKLYYVMDLVDGEPLHEVTARGRLAWSVAVDVAIGICDGVAALHDVGVIHRDLKPPNIVLGADGPVVLDLGLARDVEQSEGDRLTQTGALMGTPLYMAPEQQMGSSVSPATDVYALGLIAHELISGYPLSESGVLPGFQAPPSPSSFDGSLPRAIDAVIARALSTDPTDRYASAGELATALREVRDRPGLSRRTLRAVAVAATLIAIALVGWLAVRYAPRPVVALPKVPGPIRPTAVPLLDAKPGRDALRELKRDADPQRRFAQLTDWLTRYPTHPDLEDARALRRSARRAFPLLTLFRDTAANKTAVKGAGAFLNPNEVIGAWSNGLTWRWTIEPASLTGTWRHEHDGIYPGRVALSPDRRAFAVCAPDRLRLFDPGRPGAEHPQQPALAKNHNAVCWIDAKTLAVSHGSPATITLLRSDARGQFRSIGTVGPHKGLVTSIAVSDDGRYLASAAFVESVTTAMGRTAFYLWDLKTRTMVWIQPMLSRARCVLFLPKTHVFLGGTNSGRLSLFGPVRRGSLGEFSGPDANLRLDGGRNAHAGKIMDMAISPDGSVLYSAGISRADDEGELRAWSVADRRQLRPTVRPRDPLVGVSVSPDGQRLLLSTRAGFEVWDATVN